MTEIKRFNLMPPDPFYMEDGGVMEEHSNGEWVRWEDVKDLLDLANDVVTLGIMEHCEKVSKDELHPSSRSHVVNS